MLSAKEIRFGTDGWRAIMCDQFTFDNVRLVCQAIAGHLQESGKADDGILVAYDARFLAEQFAEVAAEVMMGNGIPVWLAQEDVPTPAAAHAVVSIHAAGAIMFTASHNPPEYNGIKFIPHYGGPAAPEVTASIEAHLQAVTSGEVPVRTKSRAEAAHMCKYHDPRPAYVADLNQLVDLAAIKDSGLAVAYDAMHGSGRAYLGTLLEEAGVKVTALHTSRDPLFGGIPPEPMAENLKELAGLVRKRAADIGLANDGDADRFGIIDSDGTYLSPNEVVSLLIPYLVEKRGMKGSVVRTVATTHLIDRLANHFGLVVHETPVGFKHVCAWMRREPVIVGGEESGGLSIGGHVPEKDGILAALLVTEVAAVMGLPLSRYLSAWAENVGPATGKRIDLRYPDEKKSQLLQRLKEAPPQMLGANKIQQVVAIDGVKYVCEDGSWMLVRASGTEPLLRIYLEASNSAALEQLEMEARELVERAV